MLLLMEHHNADTLTRIRVFNSSGKNSKGVSAPTGVEPDMATWYCINLFLLNRLQSHTFEVNVSLIEKAAG